MVHHESTYCPEGSRWKRIEPKVCVNVCLGEGQCSTTLNGQNPLLQVVLIFYTTVPEDTVLDVDLLLFLTRYTLECVGRSDRSLPHFCPSTSTLTEGVVQRFSVFRRRYRLTVVECECSVCSSREFNLLISSNA